METKRRIGLILVCVLFIVTLGGMLPSQADADTVTINKAEWDCRKQDLYVRATSSKNGDVQLTAVYGGSSYPLQYKSNRQYYELTLRSISFYPTVAVTSSGGGSDTAAVAQKGDPSECPGACVDNDGDGYGVGSGCAGPDCDDTDDAVYPGAMEMCNGIDDNCDSSIDEGFDLDGDGWTTCGGDCNDADPAINPGAAENCTDGVDNDCDGLTDSNDPDAVNCPADCTDNDRDGYGTGTACLGPDCDDTNPAVNPFALEICNGIDDNCNSLTDEGFDQDDDGWTTCDGDCDDNNPAVNPGVVEDCTDGIDNDCDELIDGADPDAVNCPDCVDSDGDGFGSGTACLGPDCNDSDPAVNPGVMEMCNGIDDNCDSFIDEGFDQDNDGWTTCEGDCNDNNGAVNPAAVEGPAGSSTCGDSLDNDCDGFTDGADPGCLDPNQDNDGDGFSINQGDCDDADPGVYPGATEICDGKDTNCDGWKAKTDVDFDKDGYPVCAGDCNDRNTTVYPGAPELCDGIDNNCNYIIPLNERDSDGDGFRICDALPDCNDNDNTVYPGALEACDLKDNDCDGIVDDDCVCVDLDGDGQLPDLGLCGGTDCDNNDATVYFGAPEICTDGKDNDCDGIVDIQDPDAVGCDPRCIDNDGDGYYTGPADALCGPADCDDTDPKVRPGAIEICDGKDTNCDGWKPPTDVDADGDGSAVCAGDCNDNNPDVNPLVLERHFGDPICSDTIDNDCDGRFDSADGGCAAPLCSTKTSPKQGPHFTALLNPDGSVHPDNAALACGKCHGANFTDPVRFACQRCHADPSDASDPLNGVLKQQYPLPAPYGFGSAANVAMHSSTVVGTTYGDWTMGAKGCVVCHNPHVQEQNNVFRTTYGQYIKEYICYDNAVTGSSFKEFVQFTSPTGPGSFADGPPYTENVCNMCHERTNHHQRDGIIEAPNTGTQDHNNGSNCTECHPHNAGFAPVGGQPDQPHNTQPFLDDCTLCHIAPDDFSSPIPDDKCNQCHSAGGALRSENGGPGDFDGAPIVLTHSDTHGSGAYTYTNNCVDCHNPMFPQANLKHIRSTIAASVIPSTVAFTAYSGPGSFADGPPHNENICETCHTMPNHHWYDGNAPADNDVTGYIGHNDSSDCTGCHPHSNAFLLDVVPPPPPHDAFDCEVCHVTPDTYVPDADIPNSACQACHDSGAPGTGSEGSDLKVERHYSDNYIDPTTGEFADITCVECHNPMSIQINRRNNTNLKFIRTLIRGSEIVFEAYTGPYSFAADSIQPADMLTENYVCNTCHTQTNHHQKDGTAPGGQSHNDGTDCTTCHPHLNAFWPDVTCVECHTGVPAGATYVTRDVVGSDFTRSSRHVFGGTVTNWDCIVCHREGDAVSAGAGNVSTTPFHNNAGGIVVDMRDVDNINSGWTWDKTGMTDAMHSDMDSFCMSCHDLDGASGINVNATDDGVNLNNTRALTPFNSTDEVSAGTGGGTVSMSGYERLEVLDVATQFDPANPSHHAVLDQAYTGHNINWGNGAWVDQTLKNGTMLITDGIYESARLHCADCHTTDQNAHSGTNGFMLQASSIDDTCFLCHNSNVYFDPDRDFRGISRWDHDQEGSVWDPNDWALLGQYGVNEGSACLNCHGGDPAVDGYGGIHGLQPGTDWRSNEPRYRFQGGSYMSHSPSSWTGTSGGTATCYFSPISDTQDWSKCTQHGGPRRETEDGRTSPPNYSRGVPRDY